MNKSLMNRIIAVRAELSDLDNELADLRHGIAEGAECLVAERTERLRRTELMRRNVAKDLLALEMKQEV